MARKPLDLHLDKGAFTKKAKAAGKGIQEMATDVLAPGSHASTKTKRQANFAKVAKTWNHKGGGKKK